MSLIKSFDRTWIVNLPHRRDRRRQMLAELHRAGMSPSPGRLEFFPAIRPPTAGTFPSVGARGCFLSHLSLLQESIASGAGRVLVMEDDLALTPQFDRLGSWLTQELRGQPWDLLFLGYHDVSRRLVNSREPNLETLEPTQPLMCTHFYAVNGDALPRLVSFLNTMLERPAGHPDGGPMHLDGAYNTFRQQNPELTTLVTTPPLGYQRSSRSDVSDPRWFDRAPMVRSVVGTLRRMRSSLALR